MRTVAAVKDARIGTEWGEWRGKCFDSDPVCVFLGDLLAGDALMTEEPERSSVSDRVDDKSADGSHPAKLVYTAWCQTRGSSDGASLASDCLAWQNVLIVEEARFYLPVESCTAHGDRTTSARRGEAV